MHAEAMAAVKRMMVTSQFTRHLEAPTPETPRYALDLGGADVNGTARDLFDPATTWFGLDIAPGPGVDIVADARSWNGMIIPDEGFPLPAFDLVLCTELLEHVAPHPSSGPDSGWQGVVETMWRVLNPGGYAFLTCASTGRRPHGARGEHDVPEGEHYHNVEPGTFEDYLLTRSWSDGATEYNPNPGDLYAWMRK